MTRRKAYLSVAMGLVAATLAAAEFTSEPTFVFLRPETSSFWRTATNSTMSVPITFPAGATKATLSVSGADYSRTYADLTGGSFTFSLPPPTSPETENVYDLTLTFDDAEATTRTAKLGLVQGLAPDSEGTTRCLAPMTVRAWQKVNGRAVLPIPQGTTSFTVDGVETDTGLGGAQGWYAIDGLKAGRRAALVLEADGVAHAASLVGGPCGLRLVIK